MVVTPNFPSYIILYHYGIKIECCVLEYYNKNCFISLLKVICGLGHPLELPNETALVVQIAFTSVVYPSLLLAYMGQAAYLSQHHIIQTDYRIGFYVSVPGS